MLDNRVFGGLRHERAWSMDNTVEAAHDASWRTLLKLLYFRMPSSLPYAREKLESVRKLQSRAGEGYARPRVSGRGGVQSQGAP